MLQCRCSVPRAVRATSWAAFAPRRSLAANSSPSTNAATNSKTDPSLHEVRRKWPWLFALGLVGSGVWLGYTGVLGTWLGYDGELDARQPDIFQDYELIKNQKISSTSYIFKIQPSTFGLRAYKSRLDGQKIIDASQKGIWSVQVKHPLLTIARSYTPIPTILRDPYAHALGEKADYESLNPQDNQLRFLIRNNPEGELSKFLARLQAGARIEIRGPYQEFEYPTHLEHVVFLAGGTGIAPALQMAHTLLEDKPDATKPRMTIFWANRLAEDCKGGVIEAPLRVDGLLKRAWHSVIGSEPPKAASASIPGLDDSPIVRELSSLQTRHPANFSICYFADDQQRFITEQDVRARVQAHPASNVQSSTNEGSGKKLIMISGPEGFVEHFAGPKIWKEGRELQGSLGGVLKKMGLSGWTIWKL